MAFSLREGGVAFALKEAWCSHRGRGRLHRGCIEGGGGHIHIRDEKRKRAMHSPLVVHCRLRGTVVVGAGMAGPSAHVIGGDLHTELVSIK